MVDAGDGVEAVEAVAGGVVEGEEEVPVPAVGHGLVEADRGVGGVADHEGAGVDGVGHGEEDGVEGAVLAGQAVRGARQGLDPGVADESLAVDGVSLAVAEGVGGIGEVVGQEDVIVVEEGHVLAPGVREGKVAGVGDTERLVNAQEGDGQLVLPAGDDLVDGSSAVADDDDLEVAVGLAGEAAQGAVERSGPVAGQDDLITGHPVRGGRGGRRPLRTAWLGLAN